MSETPRTDLTEAARAELEPLANLVETTFSELTQSLTQELGQAALDGRRSIADLADGIIEELARIGAESLIQGPLENIFASSADPFLSTVIKRSGRNG